MILGFTLEFNQITWVFGVAMALVGSLITYLVKNTAFKSTYKQKIENLEAQIKKLEEKDYESRVSVLEDNRRNNDTNLKIYFDQLSDQIKGLEKNLGTQLAEMKSEVYEMKLESSRQEIIMTSTQDQIKSLGASVSKHDALFSELERRISKMEK